MEDHYKGDSPSKKVARFEYWSEVLKIMGRKFFTLPHLVLVSRVAGDIPVLSVLGVPMKNIIAVDRNPKAAYEAQQRYPQVQVVAGDVVNIAAEYKRGIGSAFLDFCDQLSAEYIQRTTAVIRKGLRDDAVFGLTYLCGREKDKALLESIENHKLIIQKREKYLEKALPYVARGEVLGSRLLKQGLDSNFLVRTKMLFFYVSSTKSSSGVPMATSLMSLDRRQGWNRQKLEELIFKEARLSPELVNKRVPAAVTPVIQKVNDCNLSEDEFRNWVLDKINEMEANGEERLTPQMIADAYNLNIGTISAWKAHRTRGTYT